MKRILFFLVTLVLLKSAFAQERTFPYFETYLVPKDSATIYFVDFKISYNKLFFEKEGRAYKSVCSAGVEIFGDNNLVYRKIDKKSVFVNSFNETKSTDRFLHRFFKAELKHGDYNVRFFFGLENVPDYTATFQKQISVKKSSVRILKPIAVKQIREKVFSTISLKTSFPFSNENYDLIIPTTLPDSVCEIRLVQFGETVASYKTQKSLKGAPNFALVGDEFILTPKQCNVEYKMFVFKNFAEKLLPGHVKIIIRIGNDKFTYPATVVWNDAPRSIYEEYVAENAMELMFSSDEIEKFENAPKYLRIKTLFDLWKKVDPDTATAYNEILSEFFSRVDYAIKNFSSPKKNDGYLKDRGVIYIRYGKPREVKVDYTSYDYNREIWDYGVFKFVFVDEKGNGDYKLVKKI